MKNKAKNLFCALGCPPGSTLHIFPNKQNDEARYINKKYA